VSAELDMRDGQQCERCGFWCVRSAHRMCSLCEWNAGRFVVEFGRFFATLAGWQRRARVEKLSNDVEGAFSRQADADDLNTAYDALGELAQLALEAK
jgi:hypothetical protein